MKRQFLILQLIVVFCVGLIIPASKQQAQTPGINFDGSLIYTKGGLAGVAEIIVRSSNITKTYTTPSNHCASLSPNAFYTSLASKAGDGDLTIRQFDTQEIIIQTPWQPEWEPCFVFWRTDTILSIRDKTSPNKFYDFDISDNTWTPTAFVPPPPPQYPPLPDYLPETDQDFILPSPRSDVYLYERCTGGQTVGPVDSPSCAVSSDFVIYDAASQAVMHILENPNPSLVGEFNGRSLVTCGDAAWSATGRYLAFEHSADMDVFSLSVYDVDLVQYLDIRYTNAEIDSCIDFHWSPIGNKLAFWMWADLHVEGAPMHGPRRTLVIFNADTNQFATVAPAYELPRLAIEDNVFGMWSPDGEAYAFVDRNNQLILADANTGESTVLDTDIYGMIAWRNAAPTANAGADQTVADMDSSGSELVALDGSASTDTDGTLVNYSWTENGIEIAAGVSPQVDLAVGAHTITLVVTDDDGATDVDEVVVNVPPAGFAVISFTLLKVNADTTTDLFVLEDGAIINVSSPEIGTNINIRADVPTGRGSPVTGSVVFDLNETQAYGVDNLAPFELVSSLRWPPPSWNYTLNTPYTLTATPYSGPDGTGTAGIPKTITFTVVSDP